MRRQANTDLKFCFLLVFYFKREEPIEKKILKNLKLYIKFCFFKFMMSLLLSFLSNYLYDKNEKHCKIESDFFFLFFLLHIITIKILLAN